MKKLSKLFNLLAISVFGVASFTSCLGGGPDYDGVCCDQIPANQYLCETWYGDFEITVYNAFTPKYYEFCDSLVKDPNLGFVSPTKTEGICTIEEIQNLMNFGMVNPDDPEDKRKCICREKDASAYDVTMQNAWTDDINSSFYVKGLENFPCNKLFIMKADEDDTSKLCTYLNYSAQSVWNGQLNTDSTVAKPPIEKQIASGEFRYRIILYTTEGCSKDRGVIYYDSDSVIDTLNGKFCVIRPGYPNKNCQGKDENDPVLMQ